MPFPPPTCPRLAVKIGSALLVDPAGAVRRDWPAALLGEVATRVKAGQQGALVSAGARRLGLAHGGRASLQGVQAAIPGYAPRALVDRDHLALL